MEAKDEVSITQFITHSNDIIFTKALYNIIVSEQ